MKVNDRFQVIVWFNRILQNVMQDCDTHDPLTCQWYLLWIMNLILIIRMIWRSMQLFIWPTRILYDPKCEFDVSYKWKRSITTQLRSKTVVVQPQCGIAAILPFDRSFKSNPSRFQTKLPTRTQCSTYIQLRRDSLSTSNIVK